MRPTTAFTLLMLCLLTAMYAVIASNGPEALVRFHHTLGF